MVVSRISVRNLFIEARALGLLVFFMIAEQVRHTTKANPKIAVRMRSRTDKEACGNTNYGQLKIRKKSQNFSLLQLFVEAYKRLDHTLWKQKQKGKRSWYQPARHKIFRLYGFWSKFDTIVRRKWFRTVSGGMIEKGGINMSVERSEAYWVCDPDMSIEWCYVMYQQLN